MFFYCDTKYTGISDSKRKKERSMIKKKSIKTTRGNPIRDKIDAKRRQTLSNVRRHAIKKRNFLFLKVTI